MQTSWFVPAIPLLPLLGSIAIAVFARRWSRPTTAMVASGAVFLAFLATLTALAQYLQGGAVGATLSSWTVAGQGYHLGLVADAVSIWFALVVTGVGCLIHVYSAGYMAHERDFIRYFAKLNYFIFAMSVLVLADSFLGMLIGWSNVGLASYFLIGFDRHRPAAAAAAMKAYITNLIGEIGMLLGIGGIITAFGTATFTEVFTRLRESGGGFTLDGALGSVVTPATFATAVGLLLLVGAAAKSAQLPLHVWLPDAMQGPTPVSALIHAATMVTAGVYMVARAYPIYHASYTATTAVAVVGALSALAGSLIACRQYDIKKILAFSTMSQIGYMFLGNGIGAHSAALFHFMTHAFFKALLFLGAGLIIHSLGGQQDIRKMGGLARKLPFAYRTFLVGTLALMGIPPFAGFFSKDEILNAALAGGHPVLWAVGVVAAGLTAFYSLRLLALTFWGEAASSSPVRTGKRNKRSALAAQAGAMAGHGQAHAHDPASMRVPVAILAVLSVVGGLLAVPAGWNLPEHFLAPYLTAFAEPAAAEAHQVIWWGMAVTLAVIAAGAYTGWRLYAAGPRREAVQYSTGEPTGLLGNGFYFDEAYAALAVQPIQAAAAGVASSGDGRIIDGAVDGLARWVRGLGGSLEWLHSGFVRRYALTMVLGVVAVVAYYALYV